MEWLVLIGIGAVLGLLCGYLASTMIRMPQTLCILLGITGALLGGALFQMTGSAIFGPTSFYIFGVVVSFGLLAGGVLAFNLTKEEKRV